MAKRRHEGKRGEGTSVGGEKQRLPLRKFRKLRELMRHDGGRHEALLDRKLRRFRKDCRLWQLKFNVVANRDGQESLDLAEQLARKLFRRRKTAHAYDRLTKMYWRSGRDRALRDHVVEQRKRFTSKVSDLLYAKVCLAGAGRGDVKTWATRVEQAWEIAETWRNNHEIQQCVGNFLLERRDARSVVCLERAADMVDDKKTSEGLLTAACLFGDYAQMHRAASRLLVVDKDHVVAKNIIAKTARPPGDGVREVALGEWQKRVSLGLEFESDSGFNLTKRDDAVGTIIVTFGLARDPRRKRVVLDELLRQFPVNILYLRDKHQLLWATGVSGIADDFTSTVEQLRSFVRETKTKPIFIGFSAGGYAALRLAQYFANPLVLSFGGATRADVGEDNRDQRVLVLREKVERCFPGTCVNLRSVYQRLEGHRVHLFFSDGHADDSYQNRSFNGLPNAMLYPIADSGEHNVFGVLQERGGLGMVRELLQEYVS